MKGFRMQLVLCTAAMACGCASFDSNKPSADAAVDADRADRVLGADADITCLGTPGWQTLGAPFDGDGMADATANQIDVEVNGNDDIAVAWTEGDPTDAYVSRWDGTAWQPIDSPLNVLAGASPITMPNLAFHLGELAVTFAEFDGGTTTRMHLYRTESDLWVAEAADPIVGAVVNQLGHGMIVQADGTVVLSWSQLVQINPIITRIRAATVLGATATELTPALDHAGVAGKPQIGFDGAGELLLQYEVVNQSVVTAMRDVDAWASHGGGTVDADPNNSAGAQEPRLGFRADRTPLLVTSEVTDTIRRVYVYELVDPLWTLRGPALEPVGDIASPRDVIEDGDGEIVVAYVDQTGTGPGSLRVRRLAAGTWEDVGTQPLSVGAVFGVSMKSDPCGRPVVAWVEEVGGERLVHVRRYQRDALQ